MLMYRQKIPNLRCKKYLQRKFAALPFKEGESKQLIRTSEGATHKSLADERRYNDKVGAGYVEA
jgi:hypothetical protein